MQYVGKELQIGQVYCHKVQVKIYISLYHNMFFWVTGYETLWTADKTVS